MEGITTHLSDGSTYNYIQGLALGFQKSQILFTAIKYDVFTIIEQGCNTAEGIATKLEVNQDALTRLLDALVAISLLYKDTLYYTNTEISKAHLTISSKEHYGFLQYDADI